MVFWGFIIFICRHENLFLGLLLWVWVLLDATILLAAKFSVCQNSDLLLRHSRWEHKVKYLLPAIPMWNSNILIAKVFIGKMFFTFYFKTCKNMIVLPPENYLFFSERVIRYIEMWIPSCLRQNSFIRHPVFFVFFFVWQSFHWKNLVNKLTDCLWYFSSSLL